MAAASVLTPSNAARSPSNSRAYPCSSAFEEQSAWQVRRNLISAFFATFSPTSTRRALAMGNKQAAWFIDENSLRFTEADLLGTGEYGKVYKVDVAVKVLTSPNKFKDANLEKWAQEIEILAQLRHPNILSFLACCRASDGRLMIITELLSGATVGSQLEKMKLPLWRRLHMARETCLGMAWLHQKQVVHQDLKLENLLLDANGAVKISDFGFAKFLPKSKKLRETRGTLFYMAPELLLAQPANHSVDVYAFGLCLWQLLKNGRGLNDFLAQFADEDIFRREVGSNGKRPSMDPSWTQGTQNVLRSCWAPAPNTRPSFAELLRRLDEVIVEEILREPKAVEIWRKGVYNTPMQTTWKKFLKALTDVMPDVKTRNIELLSLYGVLVSHKTGNRNDRDGTVTIQGFASLLQCFPLTRDAETFVDDLHRAVLAQYCPLYSFDGKFLRWRVFYDAVAHAELRWFHGEMVPGETERLLKNKSVGKFLVHMESSEEAGLVLSRLAPPKTFAAPAAAPATAKSQKNMILNKKISLQTVGSKTRYVIGKQSAETLVDLITDLMQRKNLSPKKCEKFINLSESIVVEEDQTDHLGT